MKGRTRRPDGPSTGRSRLAVSVSAALLACSCGSQAPLPGSSEEVAATQSDGGVARVDLEADDGPRRSAFQLSPDGARVSYVVTDGRASAIWVAPVAEPSAARELVTAGDDPIATHLWALTGHRILYERGDRVFSVEVDTGAAIDLTPGGVDRGSINAVGYAKPKHVLVGGAVLYLVDIETGEHTLVQQDAGFDGFYANHALRPVLAYRVSGEVRVLSRVGRRGSWQELGNVSSVVGVDEAGPRAYVLADRTLLSASLRDGRIRELAKDVTSAIVEPRTGALEAYAIAHGRQWWADSDDIAASLRRLTLLLGGDFEVVGRSLDDRYWLVSAGRKTHRFDRSTYALDPI